jgi:hypothetical protein
VPDGKKDPKKDKGSKKVEDKNAIVVDINDPQDIKFVKGKSTIVYNLDYKLIEKTYLQSVPVNSAGEFVVPGLQEGHKKEFITNKEVTAEDKIKLKQKKVMRNYDIILSLKSWVTVNICKDHSI